MGKEQDLLDASRSGHLHIIEKILTARVKKSGPLTLTSLRRLPGPNTTDPRNGFTCLHYASLNGHKDIVRILLEHGANPNVVDHNGSSPLHLASWTGDYEIVDMLISVNNNDLSTNKADINLKNKDNETALHSACQYGHTPVVSLLLTQGADPFIQNIRHETPLDLASQYGRLETIELLLRLRFDLLNEYLPPSTTTNHREDVHSIHGIQKPLHSPLHLASRNGHKSIVKLLLDLGFDVNYLTINGTALHEAVLCGKNEVVRLLLEAGTDVQLCNDKSQKVEELLDGLNTSVAKQTKKLIREHLVQTNLIMTTRNNRNNELISPMSDSQQSTLSAATLAAATSIASQNNSFCQDQSEDQDLTIVDSMLQEDISLYNHHHHHHGDFDDLIMDDEDETDVQCISPPPGYTDNPGGSDNAEPRMDQHLYMLNNDGNFDCVSPSSSLFSTSIFSELASIFEEHLHQRNPTIVDHNKNDQQEITNHQNKMKPSNSFTMTTGGGEFRSTTSSKENLDDDDNHNDVHVIYHHQSFNDVARYQDSPTRMTTPNLLLGMSNNRDDQNTSTSLMMMSTSLNSNSSSNTNDGIYGVDELRKYFVSDNRDSMMISTSNYSISSAASSSNILNNMTQMQSNCKPRPPPTKPPRKSIEKLSKARSIDQCPLSSNNNKISFVKSDNEKIKSELVSFVALKQSSATELNCANGDGFSDVADSSDYSALQHMNSVISNDYKIKNRKQSNNVEVKKEDKIHTKDSSSATTSNNRMVSSSVITSGHSIDDFYMLYDLAASGEYERNHRSSSTNFHPTNNIKHSNSMDLLKETSTTNMKEMLNEEEKKSKTKTIEPMSNDLNNDPPSPHSAETEIIHAIEPLKQHFYHYGQEEKTTTTTTATTTLSLVTKRYKKRKKSLQETTSSGDKVSITTAKNCHEYLHLMNNNIKRRDNWTLTDDQLKDDIDGDEKMKSVGILVQIGEQNQDGKLITECGVESSLHEPKNRSRNKNKHQQQKNSEIKKGHEDNKSKQKVKSSMSSKTNDYFSAYCETLKFDRKGEKENPFAGLCRGGLTSAKTNHPKKIGTAPNGTMEKKKKTVELSETRKSLRKQRSILSGRAKSLTKLSKLSVYNPSDAEDINRNSNNETIKSIGQRSSTTTTGSGAIITQPNNIYATLRKKKKSKSLSGDHHLSLTAIDISNNGGQEDNLNSIKDQFGSNNSTNTSSSIVQDQSQQIFLWLKEIEMQQYKDILIQNGYDDLDFMDNNVMDDNDLIEIGIIQASHRDAILKAAQHLPYRTPKLTRNEIQLLSVAQWLKQIHLKQYVDIFHNNGLIELRKIRNIWEVELETMLEIDKCGHRRRILYSLSDFNLRDSIVSDNSDALSPWLTDNASTCTNLERERGGEQLEAWKGWKHARHELVNGSCQYLVSYLGSTLVRELRGINSTRASIGKLKSSSSSEQILKILLSISCQGVQFKDPKSNRLICEHEIRNIHCICQDSEDLNYFAYITKDFESNNHYCHVFMSTQTDLVTEIILTLGQAFEIAYQIVLEQYNIHVKHQHQQQNNSSSENQNYETQSNCSSQNNYTIYVKDHPNNNKHFGNDDEQKVKRLSTSNFTTENLTTTKNIDELPNRTPSPPLPPPPPDKLLDVQCSVVSEVEETKKVKVAQSSLSINSSFNNGITINEDPNNKITELEQQQKEEKTIDEKKSEKVNQKISSSKNEIVGEEEQLYAVVDKSRKTKNLSSSMMMIPINLQEEQQENEKENRPIPPIRSSSTASSNSSTGTRPDSQQRQQKPKPPVRVQSMQQQPQKPEVSPKPKNLLNKSNTVQLVTSSNMSNKPVLARFACAYQQPHLNHSNNNSTKSTNSLPQQTTSTYTNYDQQNQRKF